MAEEISKTPFKLITSATSASRGSSLHFDGLPIRNVLSVSVENILAVGDAKRSRVVIEMLGETEVEQDVTARSGDDSTGFESDDGA